MKANSRAALGISGTAAAKFYRDTYLESQLAILEQDNCPRGTWNSSEKLGRSRDLTEDIFAKLHIETMPIALDRESI